MKQTYQNNSIINVRDIRDPIDHSLIAVTFEGVYDLRSFFNGYDTVKDEENNDVKSPASGKEWVSANTQVIYNFAGLMVYEEMVHRILLEKMGVENYSPKFLKVVQPAGLNKETNQKGKRYLFLVPVYAASNSLIKVEKVKAIVQSLHASEYVNSNGQPKKFSIVNLSPITLEEGQEAAALFHLSELVKCNSNDNEMQPSAAGGGRGEVIVNIKDEKVGQEEDNEGVKTSGSSVGKSKKAK